MREKMVHLVSLGCPKNLVDTEVMTAQLAALGYEITPEANEAELIVLNTCAFILPAQEESIEEILRLAQYKRPGVGSCRHLVVAGCMPQRFGEGLQRSLPEVDLFVGPQEVANMGRHVRDLIEGRNQGALVAGEPTFLMTAGHPRILATPPHLAYLKIAEGCSNCCSYCNIPLIRGRARSRKLTDVISEAAILVEKGVKELILIAQDTTAYGDDLPERPTLSALLKELVRLEGLRWIRLLYTYPGRLTRDTLEIMAGEEKICKYIDMPIQHIDDPILKAMNRRTDSSAIIRAIAEIREIIPTIALRTSLIVGFPGEGKEAFLKLLRFVKQTRFDHLGVFKYSRESDTAAAGLAQHIPARTKESRRRRLMEVQAEISSAINQGLIGSKTLVMVEEKSDLDGYDFIGRAERQAPDIDGLTYLKGPHLKIGDLTYCQITGADEYDLFAEAVEGD